MLQDLDEHIQSGRASWTMQAIITKADLGTSDAAIQSINRSVFENAPTCLPPIVTSSLKSNGLGVGDVRKSIAEACSLARSSR